MPYTKDSYKFKLMDKHFTSELADDDEPLLKNTFRANYRESTPTIADTVGSLTGLEIIALRKRLNSEKERLKSIIIAIDSCDAQIAETLGSQIRYDTYDGED